MLVRMLGFIVLVVLLALLVLVVLRAREGLDRRVKRLADDPDARHQAALDDARRELRQAEKRHARRVKKARKALVEARRDPVLAKVGPVTLGACTVTVRKVVHELSPSTTFRVDVEGEIQQVVTEQNGRQKVTRDDQREVYLTLTDDTWADVVKLGPRQLEGARRLAAAGAAAVRTLEAARAQRDARVRAAQDELERVRTDTAEVETARMTVEDLGGAPPRPIDVPGPPPTGAGGRGEDREGVKDAAKGDDREDTAKDAAEDVGEGDLDGGLDGGLDDPAGPSDPDDPDDPSGPPGDPAR